MIRTIGKILRTKAYEFLKGNFPRIIKIKGFKMLGYCSISHWCLCYMRWQVSLWEDPKWVTLFKNISKNSLSKVCKNHLDVQTSPATFFCKMIVGDHSFPAETCTTEVPLYALVQAFRKVPPANKSGLSDPSRAIGFASDEYLAPRPHSLKITRFQTNFCVPSVQRANMPSTMQGG